MSEASPGTVKTTAPHIFSVWPSCARAVDRRVRIVKNSSNSEAIFDGALGYKASRVGEYGNAVFSELKELVVSADKACSLSLSTELSVGHRAERMYRR